MRPVPVLAGAQVLGGVGFAAGVAVGGILAEDISGSMSLAGLTQTMGVLGAALLAVPLARLAARSGRRGSLSTGYALGATGAVLCLTAAVTSTFGLLLIGTLLFGGGTAAGLQARYAAADGADAAHRARSLSVVMWATTVGAVAGPNLVGPGEDVARWLGIPQLAGPYVFSVVAFLLASLVLVVLLRNDPRRSSPGTPDGSDHRLRELLAGVCRSPGAVVGLATVAAAYAVMVAVMVMTPLHLHDGGATLEVVGLVLSVHIAGMYIASPLFGAFADRYGREAGIVLGVAVLALSLVLSGTAPPTAHARLAVALTLLGLGWSACLVAGSTLLSEAVEPHLRTGVQGMSDMVMNAVAALAGALSGPLMRFGGYPWLSAAAGLLLVPVIVLLARAGRTAGWSSFRARSVGP